jgi:pimeloyl-ACP methyl ester carboxylesterase
MDGPALKEDSFETSDGVVLRYREEGSGPPIIFVHGWAATRRFWEGSTRQLAEGYRTISIDLRGHGASDKQKGLDYSFARMTRDILELVDNLGISAPIMVGHSLGGLISAHCASDTGSSGLVLTGVSKKIQVPIMRLRILMKMRWLAEKLVTPRMFAPGVDEKLLDFVRNESARSSAGVLVEVMKQTVGSELPTHLGNLKIPILVVAGEFDSLVPMAGQQRMARELEGKFDVVEGAGHNLMLEKPDEFVRILREFAGLVFDKNT